MDRRPVRVPPVEIIYLRRSYRNRSAETADGIKTEQSPKGPVESSQEPSPPSGERFRSQE